MCLYITKQPRCGIKYMPIGNTVKTFISRIKTNTITRTIVAAITKDAIQNTYHEGGIKIFETHLINFNTKVYLLWNEIKK